MAAKPNLKVERVALDAIQVHPQNPRVGNIDVIAESLMAHSQYMPLVVQASTGNVLAGNHRLLAAHKLGWTHIEVVRVDVDDEEATRILLVDNKSSDDASYDDDLLAGLLDGLPDLSGTGYDEDDLDDLLATTGLPAPLEIAKQGKNGGKALTGLGLQWGFLQWKQRRVTITADEVARLDALHDAFTKDQGTEAGFVHLIADLAAEKFPSIPAAGASSTGQAGQTETTADPEPEAESA